MSLLKEIVFGFERHVNMIFSEIIKYDTEEELKAAIKQLYDDCIVKACIDSIMHKQHSTNLFIILNKKKPGLTPHFSKII